MNNEVIVPPASAELFVRKYARGKFKPVLHYQPTLCLLSIYTEDVSYVATWVSPALEVFFRNHPSVDDTAVGLSICCRLNSTPEEMLGAWFRHELGWFFYPPFRLWYNATRKLIPARELLDILGIKIPNEAWGKYKHQAMKVLETPVFVRLV